MLIPCCTRGLHRVLHSTHRYPAHHDNLNQRETHTLSMSTRLTPNGRPILADEGRAATVPLVNGPTTRSLSDSRPSSIPPASRCPARLPSEGSLDASRDDAGATSLDLTDLLRRSEPSVVKTRNGSVLSRGFILKTDHYPSGVLVLRFCETYPYLASSCSRSSSGS